MQVFFQLWEPPTRWPANLDVQVRAAEAVARLEPQQAAAALSQLTCRRYAGEATDGDDAAVKQLSR